MHSTLDGDHQAAALNALKVAHVRAAAESLILDPNVVVFHRCDHLSCYYSLNRFLAHLFNEVMQTTRARPLLVGNCAVINGENAAFGSGYELDVVTPAVCYEEIPLDQPPTQERVTSVLVRYGLDPSQVRPPWPEDIDLPRNRHSLPNSPQPY